MSEIYLVTAGIYSDYGVLGVFDSKEKAEQYAEVKKITWDNSTRVETYELNPEVPNIDEIICKITMTIEDNEFYTDYANFEIVDEYEKPDFEIPDEDGEAWCSMCVRKRKDETVTDFKKRAVKVLIDTYWQWRTEQRK